MDDGWEDDSVPFFVLNHGEGERFPFRAEEDSVLSGPGDLSFDPPSSPSPIRSTTHVPPALPANISGITSPYFLSRPQSESHRVSTEALPQRDEATSWALPDSSSEARFWSPAQIQNDPFDDEPVATTQVMKDRVERKRAASKSKNGIVLIPVSDITDHGHREPFEKYTVFNEIQSAVFEAALCNEKTTDWRTRLRPVVIRGADDTGTSHDIFQTVRDAQLIVTTPEKLDSMTRRTGKLSEEMNSRLSLIMIDEVHILQEDRGATLEVVISRIKLNCPHVRFVAVSATVPNTDDIARWLGSRASPMELAYDFGEEYRPVPLLKTVYGIEACQSTGEYIYKLYEEALAKGGRIPWQFKSAGDIGLEDKGIEKLAMYGIAVHHAGLTKQDRRMIEEAFRVRRLDLLISTSVAVGVNLPAHTVIIKGTSAWQGAGFREYTDIEIQQMMGRAGRPQYDNTGVVVIMCDKAKLRKYQAMVRSDTILESSLHLNLTEHLNSQIGLSTINTFLYIRIQQNPRYYALPDEAAGAKPEDNTWKEWLNRWVDKSLQHLEETGLIIRAENDEDAADQQLLSTDVGNIMSNCMICSCQMQMACILEVTDGNGMAELLEVLAAASEFSSLRIRPGEGPVGPSSSAYRLPPSSSINCGNIQKSDSTYLRMSEPTPILQVAASRRYGKTLRAALDLYRMIQGMAWENCATIFRQLKNIAFDQFLDTDATELQLILNRNTINYIVERKSEAKRLPRFTVTLVQEGIDQSDARSPATLLVRVSLFAKNRDMSLETSKKRNARTVPYTLSMLFLRQDESYIDYRRMLVKAWLKQKDPSYVLKVPLDRHCEKILAIVSGTESPTPQNRCTFSHASASTFGGDGSNDTVEVLDCTNPSDSEYHRERLRFDGPQLKAAHIGREQAQDTVEANERLHGFNPPQHEGHLESQPFRSQENLLYGVQDDPYELIPGDSSDNQYSAAPDQTWNSGISPSSSPPQAVHSTNLPESASGTEIKHKRPDMVSFENLFDDIEVIPDSSSDHQPWDHAQNRPRASRGHNTRADTLSVPQFWQHEPNVSGVSWEPECGASPALPMLRQDERFYSSNMVNGSLEPPTKRARFSSASPEVNLYYPMAAEYHQSPEYLGVGEPMGPATGQGQALTLIVNDEIH
ncbi:hypothetical protein IAU60_003863 [Kwoniella sp. DSM 27419]